MGQYYAAVIKKPRARKQAIYTANYEKLMAHSWVGNSYTDAITNMLTAIPARVWWVGDYTEPNECNGFDLESVWGDHKNRRRNRIARRHLEAKPNVKYLINHTKKVYIDLEEYSKASTDANGELIYPLAILTCTSNGRGGGDFYPTEDSTANLIGAWAGDLVCFSIAFPNTYTKISPIFKE